MKIEHGSVFDRASVPIAKHRLKYLLIEDRTSCSSDEVDQLTEELFTVCSKYIKTRRRDFQVAIDDQGIYITY